jgi:hypothetical protein
MYMCVEGTGGLDGPFEVYGIQVHGIQTHASKNHPRPIHIHIHTHVYRRIGARTLTFLERARASMVSSRDIFNCRELRGKCGAASFAVCGRRGENAYPSAGTECVCVTDSHSGTDCMFLCGEDDSDISQFGARDASRVSARERASIELAVGGGKASDVGKYTPEDLDSDAGKYTPEDLDSDAGKCAPDGLDVTNSALTREGDCGDNDSDADM